jgi:hypothetical protein
MASEMAHLRVLAEEIGPRPATTDAEAHAADYIEAVFAARGLEVERQEFSTPRTYSWAYVIYHVFTISAAVASGYAKLFWPALALSALSAIVMWSDLDTRWGLSALMPKGPSQNIVARNLPKTHRGERSRTVVVVAHYDSAKASLAFAPGMVKNFAATFALMKACTFAVPFMILAAAFPQTEPADPYLWYATMVVSAYLLVPLLINVHRELFMAATPGANDNASGVAAMLGVMEAVVPEPGDGFVPKPVARRRGIAEVRAAAVLPEDTILSYTPAGAPDDPEAGLPDGFAWAEPESEPVRGQGMLDFDTVEFEAVDASRGAGPEAPTASATAKDAPKGAAKPKKPRRFSGSKDGAVTSWLGVGDDFSARVEGRKIGSWDNFGEPDEDDEFGLKGGWAGDDPIGDPEYAANEAARIRRRVSEVTDRDLQEKDVWFVATGAEEVGTRGMHAFLAEYGADLRDAVFINIDNVGAGALYWVTAEGMARRYPSDRRLVSLAKRVSREHNMLVRPRAYKGLSTDATPALARKYRAMSVMSFDINGHLPNWHWRTDTIDNVSPELVELASAFVTAMVRDL